MSSLKVYWGTHEGIEKRVNIIKVFIKRAFLWCVQDMVILFIKHYVNLAYRRMNGPNKLQERRKSPNQQTESLCEENTVSMSKLGIFKKHEMITRDRQSTVFFCCLFPSLFLPESYKQDDDYNQISCLLFFISSKFYFHLSSHPPPSPHFLGQE